MVSSSNPNVQVHSLNCTACGDPKDNLFMELCPKCEQAMLLHFPIDYFKADPLKAKAAKQKEAELQAVKILEALELASIDAPIDLTA